jgi:hypothetical protein
MLDEDYLLHLKSQFLRSLNYADAWKGKSDALSVLNRPSEVNTALVTARHLGYKG